MPEYKRLPLLVGQDALLVLEGGEHIGFLCAGDDIIKAFGGVACLGDLTALHILQEIIIDRYCGFILRKGAQFLHRYKRILCQIFHCCGKNQCRQKDCSTGQQCTDIFKVFSRYSTERESANCHL